MNRYYLQLIETIPVVWNKGRNITSALRNKIQGQMESQTLTGMLQKMSKVNDNHDNMRVSELEISDIEMQKENVTLKDDKYDTLIRDLHDTLQQTLLVLNMKLRKAKLQYPADHDSKVIDESLEYSQQALLQMKKILSGEKEIGKDDLYDRICHVAQDLASTVDFQITIENYLKGNFPKHKVSEVVKIVSEVLSNAIKYSNANHLHIHLNESKDKIFITIKDDGVGFDLDKVNEGHGLKNIRHRIKQLNGSVHISSDEGKGTSIRMSVAK